MAEIVLTVGKIVRIANTGKRYRVIGIAKKVVVLCEMDTTTFKLSYRHYMDIIEDRRKGLLEILEEDDERLFDFDMLKGEHLELFLKKKDMLQEIVDEYGPSYYDLAKKVKNVDKYFEKYGVKKTMFWKTLRLYFQSGMSDLSLVDGRLLKIGAKRDLTYNAKPGCKPKNFIATGKLLTDEDNRHIDHYIDKMRKNRNLSVAAAYADMIAEYYTRDDGTMFALSDMPTITQFRYRFKKLVSPDEREIIKTSLAEFRNNKRLTLSDSLMHVVGPMDCCEVDENEFDLSLVDEKTGEHTVGRAIVYLMIDVFTKVIVAVGIGYENNSTLGFTSLLLNLCEDKKEYCRRNGVEMSDTDFWPTGFLPRRMRVDRGSEYRSKFAGEICNRLKIQKELVPPRMGSLKGNVEHVFDEINKALKSMLHGVGLIEKRYDSNHHKQATLNISDFRKIVVRTVLYHNSHYYENYPLTNEMLKKGVQKIPSEIWQYGMENCIAPNVIGNKRQFWFDLLKPVKATLCYDGIKYRDLIYDCSGISNIYLPMKERKDKTEKIDIRLDPRLVDFAYYMKGSEMFILPLSSTKTGNLDNAGYTWKEYEYLWHEKKRNDAYGKVANLQQRIDFNSDIKDIIGEAKSRQKGKLVSVKDMRQNRQAENQRINKEDSIAARIAGDMLENGTLNDAVLLNADVVDVEVVDTVEPVVNVPSDSVGGSTAISNNLPEPEETVDDAVNHAENVATEDDEDNDMPKKHDYRAVLAAYRERHKLKLEDLEEFEDNDDE